MLDREHALFIQSGVSISLAAGAVGRPSNMSRGLGCKLYENGKQIGVFIRRSQSIELIENIHASQRVANVFSLPSTHRTLQLKGVGARVMAFDPADLAIVENHTEEFLREVLPLGIPETVLRALFAYSADDLVSVIYSPCAAFSQTPGPKAGEALKVAR